ncbi:MAG: hypothetical protein IPQ04_12015 [Saprospiraceae bacterium]|nr:hypothetical protein [Saprospiraceae bacterium]
MTVVKTTDNLKAAELFRTKDIDAAVVWSPDDIKATRCAWLKNSINNCPAIPYHCGYYVCQ